MLNTLLPLLLAVPLTVTPYRSPNPLTVRDLCDDIAISLTEAVEYKVITPVSYTHLTLPTNREV